MASEPSTTAPVSDPLSKPTRDEAPQQENGDGHLSKPAEDSTLTEPTETKSLENSTPANGISNGSLPETEQEQSKGEKRELETTSTTAKPSVEEPAEPTSKKQKTSGTSAPAQPETAEPSQTAPEKKKGGRPRKTKDSVKKNIPTNGIGSRTRSRTKVAS
ncbi:hypothetical protein BJX76DRAFT_355892 [Aspergillus varians]